MGSSPWFLETASIAAHLTSGGPCLVIDPRRTLVSDSRCRGLNPAHEQTCLAERNRETSPSSAVKSGPEDGADTIEMLDGLITGMVFELSSDPHI